MFELLRSVCGSAATRPAAVVILSSSHRVVCPHRQIVAVMLRSLKV